MSRLQYRSLERILQGVAMNKNLFRVVLYCFIIYGCFLFPFSKFSNGEKYLLFVYVYGHVGIWFSCLNNPVKFQIVFAQTAFFTAIGLLCRYCLDYGAILNTMKYTWFNIITYMSITPLFVTMFSYYISLKLSLPKSLTYKHI